jgi:hypothetical protein
MSFKQDPKDFRKCLRCSKLFLSSGTHNRICYHCSIVNNDMGRLPVSNNGGRRVPAKPISP